MSPDPFFSTEVAYDIIFRPVYPWLPVATIEVIPAPSQTLVAGTIMAQRSSDGKWKPYDPAAAAAGTPGQADAGLNVPRGVLKLPTTVTADGIVQFGDNPFGLPAAVETTSIYVVGSFPLQTTIGNLSAALSNNGFGRIIEGFLGGTGVWKLL